MSVFHLSDDDMRSRLNACLLPVSAAAGSKRRGDFDLNPAWRESVPTERALRPAAVLVPIVEREAGLRVLFTLRASHLPAHAGQVSFPGGRIESADGSPWHAALRETHEEVGIAPDRVEFAGYLPDHLVGTGFRVTPVVGFVTPPVRLTLASDEVQDVFEVPLDYLFDVANHSLRRRLFGETEVHFHDIRFQQRSIWGATAGILLTWKRLADALREKRT